MKQRIPLYVTGPGPQRPSRRRGASLIYTMVVMLALVGIAGLGVDWGHVTLARTELDRAITAAARYAVAGISDGSALAKANLIGGQNSVDGSALSFTGADVVVGNWNGAAFVAGASPPNAVRVTGRRTAATGNAIRLTLSQIIGMGSFDLVSSAVVTITSRSYGIVGINYVTLSGASTDGYWPSGASGHSSTVSVASNGNITLSGAATIHGDAHPGPGMTVKTSGASDVTGSSTPLSAPLSYPDANAGAYVTINNNADVPAAYLRSGALSMSGNQSLTLPGGTYYFTNFNLSGGSNVSFTGPATIYCCGSFNLSGNTSTANNLPGNLTLIMCPAPGNSPPGSVTLSGNSALYCSIYAPQSNVSISGTGDFYGSVVGLSVTQSGNGAIHNDLSLNNQNSISLVQ